MKDRVIAYHFFPAIETRDSSAIVVLRGRVNEQIAAWVYVFHSKDQAIMLASRLNEEQLPELTSLSDRSALPEKSDTPSLVIDGTMALRLWNILENGRRGMGQRPKLPNTRNTILQFSVSNWDSLTTPQFLLISHGEKAEVFVGFSVQHLDELLALREGWTFHSEKRIRELATGSPLPEVAASPLLTIQGDAAQNMYYAARLFQIQRKR